MYIISNLNDIANFFQWAISAVSTLRSHLNGAEKQKLQGDVQKLKSDVQVLGDSLPLFYGLIERAEWSHESCVAELLPKLKDAVYEAEDLLEDFQWHQLKVKIEGNATSVEEPVINFFRSVIQGSFNKVTDIRKRLDNLHSQLTGMGLYKTNPRFDKSVRPETTSFPTEAKIFGRQKEIKELIGLLGVHAYNSRDPSKHKKPKIEVSSSANNQVRAQVLPIVGMGGVGKTTLAQNICNHPKVKPHFNKIIWICVSDDFDVERLTKEALKRDNGTRTDNLDSLQRALYDLLHNKRFLLILDDVWDDALKENGDRWKRFCGPITGLQGSMILVTTRSQKVADLVRTMDRPYPLNGLKNDVFWDFFNQCVFGRDRSNNYPELNRIGTEILKKLGGSPLAAKTVGRLLGMSLDPAYWDSILKSQLWELRQNKTDILPALRLSYMYLPSHLKRCFSFCAVYPKDYNFEKEDLAELWVAEGFVKSDGNIPLQHISCQYFEELEHLSFLQKLRGKYVIHDLIHDMAQLVSKDECFIVKDKKDIEKIPQNVRHLSVLKSGDVKCSDLMNLCKHSKLRTLICNVSLKSKTGNTVMEKWCTELLCMRVMVCASISKSGLPDRITNMKHLRYLKIFDSCLSNSLPDAFCCLYNLRILYARKWEIDSIPSGFSMLINLQKFKSSKYQFTVIGHRRHFKFSKYKGEPLPRGFHAQNLPDITSLLIYSWDKVKSISFYLNSEQIHNYDNIGSTFSSLTDVQISNCINLSSLEQFLHPACVPAIKEITIVHCTSLESVPTKRFGDFCSLEILSVRDCPKICSRHLFSPYLKKLYLENSGNLGDIIECSSLTILHLKYRSLESIELQMWNLPLLQELEITFCHFLKCIGVSELISTDLFIGGTRSSIGKFPLLTQLVIRHCTELKTIDDLLYLPVIESIIIENCKLLSLPTERLQSFPLLMKLKLSGCPSLDWQSGMLLPSSLQNLELWRCGDFSAWFPNCLESLNSLKSLHISYCEGIVSIPGHLWSSNLRSLQKLIIQNCPELVSIGTPMDIANIENIFIEDCPALDKIKQPLRTGIWR